MYDIGVNILMDKKVIRDVFFGIAIYLQSEKHSISLFVFHQSDSDKFRISE
uniref:Uncharacterized protein n=1 Tax=Microplitis mediator bracovirus TaxID=1836595 RepID=A0A2I6SGW4_9VIRU|nr:hypothetical protein MmBV_CMP8 [Microplitis mediator bracovirus]